MYLGGKKVKEKYRPKLQEDFNKYCKQIGILEKEKPQLITDKKTMDELKQTFPDKGRGSSTGNNYGICYRKQRIIHVNGNKRIHHNRTYMHVKYTDAYKRRHKTSYRDLLETLVHELVHYRWRYLQHGAKYEQRIREILRSKVFPEKVLYDDNISLPEYKSITNLPVSVGPIRQTTIDQF